MSLEILSPLHEDCDDSLLFVGGPAHGEAREVPSDARYWKVAYDARGRSRAGSIASTVIYTRCKAYEFDAQGRPDFFHVMACTDDPWQIGDALQIARKAGWAGPTYIMRGAEWVKLASAPFEEVEGG